MALRAGKNTALAKQENFSGQAAKTKSDRRHERKNLCLIKNLYNYDNESESNREEAEVYERP